MTTARNVVLIVLLGWIDFSSGGNKNLVRRREMRKFLAGRADSLHPTSRENPVYIYIYIYIYNNYIYIYYIYNRYYTDTYIKELCQQVSRYNGKVPCTSHTTCAKVAIFCQIWALPVSQIYMDIFSLVCSVFVIQ